MKKIINQIIFQSIFLDLLLIFLLSLVTLRWVGPGQIIDGNDTIYPLKPISFFQERLYQWKHLTGAGVDFSYGSAGLTWHGFQALLAKIGLDIFTNQKIFLLFWFNAISFSFYFLIACLLPDKSQRLARLAGTIFYAFNPYLFNLWSNIQSANLTGYVFIPIATGCLFKAFNDLKNYICWLILASMASVLCSAMGGNPQVIFVVGMYLLLFFLYVFYDRVVKSKNLSGSQFFKTVTVFTVLMLFANCFWVIPEYRSVSSGNFSLAIPSKEKLRGWLDSLSLNTSALNVIKMQGEWTWYDEYRKEPYIPFADFYKTNPVLIIVSFLAFFLSTIAIFKSKEKWVSFYSLVLGLGLLLSMGTKAPFGYLYLFLTERIKFFSFLRSPWYKFSLLTCVSYPVLVALFIHWFLAKNSFFKKLIVFLIIGGQLIYCYPMITGEVLPEKFKILPPYKFSIPDYIWKSDKWLRDETEEFRVAVTPKQTERDFYYWGYGAPYQLLNLFANPKPVLNGSEWTVVEAEEINRLIDVFYEALYHSYTKEAAKILAPLNVKYLLQKNDYNYDFMGSLGSPDFVKEKISQQKYFQPSPKIGAWDFYEIDKNLRFPLIYGTDKVEVLNGDITSLGSLFLLNNDFPVAFALESDLLPRGLDFLRENYLSTRYFLSGYLLKKDPNFWPLTPFARFSPKHPAYFYSLWKEENALNKAKTPAEKIPLGLFYAGKRIGEAEIISREDWLIPGNDLILKKLIDDYLKKIETVRQDNGEVLRNTFDKQSGELVQNIYISLQIHRAKLVTIYYAIPNSKADVKEVVYLAIEEILNFQNEIKQTIAQKTSLPTRKNFVINASQAGEYEIYLAAEGLEGLVFQRATFKIKAPGWYQETRGKLLDNGWLFLGSFVTEAGKKEIELDFPRPVNYLEELSFRDWQIEGGVQIKNEEGEDILVLETKETTAAASIRLSNLDLGRSYTLSFQYRTLSQGLPRLMVSSPGNSWDFLGNTTYKRDGELDYHSVWQETEVIMEPDNNQGEVMITFRLDRPPVWGERSLAQIKNVKVHQDTEPLLILKKKEGNLETTQNSLPTVSFTKINPTKYLVDVKGAQKSFLLVFLENFHPLWRASTMNGKGELQPLDEEKHLKVNGFANGWLVSQSGDYQMVLEYSPQREYQFLLMVSLLALSGNLVYLLIYAKNNFLRLFYSFKEKDD